MRWAWLFAGLAALAAEPGYVDPASCRQCHAKIVDSFNKTGMGRSFGKIAGVPALTNFFHQPSDRYYSVVERSDGHYLRRSQAGRTNVIEKRIDYVIGSGNHSKTFLHRDGNGQLIELPVSWYSERGGYWAMSPGYDRTDHSDLRREVSDSCLFCHNGYPSQANGGLASGIDCQRCHGPGQAHVNGGGSIVNPGKLNAERQLEICLQCHLESSSRTLPDALRRFGRGPFSYRPGEPLGDFMLYFDFVNRASDDRITVNGAGYGLLRSRCFLQSAGRLTCTTCHDPHGAAKNYTQICGGCHQAAHTPTRTAAHRDCAGCHMQKRRTEDAVHVVMTDHYIRPRPLPGNLLSELPERHDRFSGPVRLLYPGQASDSAIYLAMANQSAPDLEQVIAAVRPKHAEPYFALGEAYRKSGKLEQAIGAYRRATELAPGDPRSYSALSTMLLERGNAAEAAMVLESAIERLPDNVEILNALAVVYARQQRFKESLRLLSNAVTRKPDDPLSWVNLGVALEATSDAKGAEAAYRQAILLQPDLARAKEYLSRISKN